MNILFLYLNPIDFTHPMVNPYGLEIISEYIRDKSKKENITVNTTISNPFYRDDPEGFLKKTLQEKNFDIIGISIRNIDNALVPNKSPIETLTKHYYLPQIAKLVSILKKSPTPIIIGGIGFSSAPEQILRYLNLNIGIVGPGEESFWELIKLKLKGNFSLNYIQKSINRLPGLVVIEQNKFYMNSCISKKISHITNIERSQESRLSYKFHNAFYALPVRFSHGCSNNCSFCIENVNSNGTTFRDTKDIVDEIEFINKKYKIFAIWLTGSEINYPNSDRLTAFCKQITKKGLNKTNTFSSYFMLKPLNTDLIHLLRKTGFEFINFSTGHFVKEVLEKNKIDLDINDITNAFNVMKKCPEMSFCFDLLLGLPGESEETLKELAKLIYSFDKQFSEGIKFVYTAGVRVYPGTQLSKKCTSRKYKKFLIQKDKSLLTPSIFSAPYEPQRINTFFLNELKQYPLKGQFKMMNDGFPLNEKEQQAQISLEKALGLLSSGEIEIGLKHFNFAKKILSLNTKYQEAFKDFSLS